MAARVALGTRGGTWKPKPPPCGRWPPGDAKEYGSQNLVQNVVAVGLRGRAMRMTTYDETMAWGAAQYADVIASLRDSGPSRSSLPAPLGPGNRSTRSQAFLTC